LSEVAKFTGPVPRGYLEFESFLPQDVFTEELRYLEEIDLIEIDSPVPFDSVRFALNRDTRLVKTTLEQIWQMSEEDYIVRLTAKGRQRHERLFTGFGKTVFVIKQCDTNLWVDQFIENVLILEFGGDKPYIQEKEEPRGEISHEIIERIENAPFIIADLTGGRENCLYELGYAHALKKRTIITRKHSEVEMATDAGKFWRLTFDISQYKHTTWKNEHDSEFKTALRERIRQTIKAIEQDYFNI